MIPAEPENDLVDEIALEAASLIMAELKERNMLSKTTPRYDDELEAQIAAIIGTAIDENLEITNDDADDEDDDLFDDEEDPYDGN